MSNIIVRFPPSPTGFLHIGNTRVAIINWLFAKKNNGKIFLRFDDTDLERSKKEFKDQMFEDLKWLGLDFDDKFEQSSRTSFYREAFDKLLENNYIYPCLESEEDLEIARKVSMANGKPFIYKKDNFNNSSPINKPYFRFHLKGDAEVCWKDAVQGDVKYQIKDLSDPVILRANGNFMYTFCSVVDDFLLNITDVIRGADHVTNTAIQIKIFEALQDCYKVKKNIQFAHLSLFQTKEGKISKRVGGFSIKELKEQGFEPQSILNVLAKIGLSSYEDSLCSKEDLINKFDITSFHKSQITFEHHLFEVFNKKIVSNLSFNDVKNRINQNITEYFFDNIKHNISFLKEADEWFEIFTNQGLNFSNLLNQEERDFLSQLLEFMIQENSYTWEEVLKICKMQFPDKKGKSLFLPIRLALTGKSQGPEMKFLFSQISKEIFKKRF